MNDTGGSAFPRLQTDAWAEQYSGMTLRDYFAGQLLPSVFGSQTRTQPDPKLIARAAYQIADAMIAERNKNE